MQALIGFAMLGLVGANVYLLREHARLRRRTMRLALLARDEARRVRSMDWATAAAFEHVHGMITDSTRTPEADAASEEPEAPAKPTFLN